MAVVLMAMIFVLVLNVDDFWGLGDGVVVGVLAVVFNVSVESICTKKHSISDTLPFHGHKIRKLPLPAWYLTSL